MKNGKKTNKKTTEGQQKDTNKNNKNINYFINKYNEQNLKNLREKMKFLRDIRNDEKYKELTLGEVDELRIYILGGT